MNRVESKDTRGQGIGICHSNIGGTDTGGWGCADSWSGVENERDGLGMKTDNGRNILMISLDVWPKL